MVGVLCLAMPKWDAATHALDFATHILTTNCCAMRRVLNAIQTVSTFVKEGATKIAEYVLLWWKKIYLVDTLLVPIALNPGIL